MIAASGLPAPVGLRTSGAWHSETNSKADNNTSATMPTPSQVPTLVLRDPVTRQS